MKYMFFLYSTIDDLVLYWFFSLLILGFLINWVVKKIKLSKIINFSINDNKQNLENYTFNFSTQTLKPSEEIQLKSTSLISKITLYVLSFILVLVPLYEFVETLRPVDYFYHWSCFP